MAAACRAPLRSRIASASRPFCSAPTPAWTWPRISAKSAGSTALAANDWNFRSGLLTVNGRGQCGYDLSCGLVPSEPHGPEALMKLGQVPEGDVGVGPHVSQPLTRRREGQVLHHRRPFREREQRFESHRVAKDHAAVGAAGGEEAPVGAEGQRLDRRGWACSKRWPGFRSGTERLHRSPLLNATMRRLRAGSETNRRIPPGSVTWASGLPDLESKRTTGPFDTSDTSLRPSSRNAIDQTQDGPTWSSCTGCWVARSQMMTRPFDHRSPAARLWGRTPGRGCRLYARPGEL